jgi:TonB-linked SusC/RagA family outer membrane protein
MKQFMIKHKKDKKVGIVMALMICLVQVCFGTSTAQSITINQTNKTVKEIILVIEKSSDMVFFYNNKDVDLNRKTSVHVTNEPVDKALNQLFANSKNTYRIDGRQIFIMKRSAQAETPAPEQQGKRITGKVVDKSGEALPGVTVQIVGSPRGVISDENGNFEMDNVAIGTKLSASFIGMQPKEFEFQGKGDLIIVLEEHTNELDEVTIVAFGKQKKESVISSIATVNVKDLKVPSSNLTTAFAGRVAGLISYQTSGEPGQDNASFFIRGITTFGADAKKDPLILIDGTELTTNDLARLNTDDIASFSIMKDATATALYGARGANGVILVTTKEGREGKTVINVRVESSFSSPTRMVDLADPVTYMRMHNESVKTRDPLGPNIYSAEKIRMTEAGTHPDIYPATNWYKAMFNDVTLNERANLSISGGGKVARYYVAVNVAQDNGNLKVDKRNNFNSNINLTQYAVRSNVNINVTKTTELILRLSSSFDDYTGPLDGGTAMYNKVIQANPVLFKPSYEPDEHYAYVKHILFGNYENGYYINPYAESLKGYKDYSINTTLTQFEIKQDLEMIVKGLKARALVNMNRYSDFTVTRQYDPSFYNLASFDLLDDTYTLWRLNPDNDETLHYTPEGRNVNSTFYLEAAAEYNTTMSEKHSLSAMLVYIMRQTKQGSADNLQLSLPGRNLGVSGRLTYNYDSRYFTEFNFGYNGSERFSKKHRWGFFPSVGLAWMLSNEAFFEPLKPVISQFKLKGTYGMVGNDAIGSANDRFYYLEQVSFYNSLNSVRWGSNMNYGPQSVSIDRYANGDIGWEKSYKTNIGAEIAFVNGFSANIDAFHEKRTNILLSRVIPKTMGIAPAVKSNLGVASGQGVDAELNYEKSFTNGLWVTGRGTFTYATSKILEWEEPDYNATPWLSRIGTKISQQYGLVAERLFVDDMEVANSPRQFGEYQGGDIKYKDVNGDGFISDLDRVPIGYPTTPEINYGFGFSVGYKGIDASVFFQGSDRQSFWLNTEGNGRIQPFLDGSYTGVGNDGLLGQNAVLQAIADNYWSEENRNPYAFWPRLANYVIPNNTRTSTWFMQDATFLRLKSAELGYTLPQSITKKAYMNNLRVYVSATNLLCWSRFKLWDPEMAGNGLGYPLQRVINVGLNIGF